jgi:DNA topoisomerase-3
MEKGNVADSLAKALGINTKESGFYTTKQGDVITWCSGHLLELEKPDFYMPADVPLNANGKKTWRQQDLPIIPQKWKKSVAGEIYKKKQAKVICECLKKQKWEAIVNGGDPDREGQYLVDEMIELCGFDAYADNVYRINTSDITEEALLRESKKMKKNSETKNMRVCAETRSISDWLIGMNGTMAYSVKFKTKLNVGRVQTPVLTIVYDRDDLIAKFKPVEFFTPVVTLTDGTELRWYGRLNSDDMHGIDSEGRIIDKKVAEAIIKRILNGQEGTIKVSDSKEKSQKPPLPHSLDSLSIELSKKEGFSSERTLEVCQSLYDTHKLTTYPRTDCRYLPKTLYNEREKTLESLRLINEYKDFINSALTNRVSEAWNDNKVTAHHAIIPTGKSLTGLKLSEDEKLVYDVISRYYIAQFQPDHKYLENKIEAAFDADSFRSTKKVSLSPGWKTVFGGKDIDDDLMQNDNKMDVNQTQTQKTEQKISNGKA